MTLGGVIVIKDGEILDYCFQQAIASLLPVCDVVAVSVAKSDDNTEEIVREWASREPKLSVNIYPWKSPKGDANFFVDWLQYARQHTVADRIIQIDSDEVVHESSYPAIEEFKKREGRLSVWMNRYNFWRNPQNLIPHGYCCAHRVVRMMPQDCWLPSDGADERGAESTNMAIDSDIFIGHYGFLRKRDAWFKKARALQGYFFDTYDKRLEAAEKYEGNWSEMPDITGWENQLMPFTGTHPEIIKPWLKERGYDIS